MTDWFARPITARPEGEFTAYAWADHTGWHSAPEPPEHAIPTGHIWTWDGSGWAARREETDRCAGLWLRHVDVTPGDDWKPTTVDVLSSSGEGTLPSLYCDKRFFRSDNGDANWHGLPAHVLRVTTSARVDLFDCPEATRRWGDIMACPSCTAEWLSAARQEGPVDDLDDGTPSAGLVRFRCSLSCRAASASRPCPGPSTGRQTLRGPGRAGRTDAD